MTTVRVLLVDDEQLIRSGLRALLDGQDGIEVVGEAADGVAACELAATLGPDVVLMDLRMPLLDGVRATQRLLEQDPGVVVVVLTTFGTDAEVLPALRAGARGFLLKNTSAAALVEAVRRAAAGEAVLDPAVASQVIEAAVSGRPAAAPAFDLTARELDVLRLLARGRSNAEIAAAMVVEVATVKTHVAHVLTKLGARTRTEAVVAAYELGLVRPGGAWPA